MKDKERKVNTMLLYKGDPYPITDKLSIIQPTLNDLIENQENFWAVIYTFIGTTTMNRYKLWQVGVDWNKISNYELFVKTVSQMPPDITSIMFGDIDFRTFQLYDNPNIKPDEIVLKEGQVKPTHTQRRENRFHNWEKSHSLYSQTLDIQINAATYHYMSDVVKEMVHIYPKNEYAVGKTSKQLIIEEQKDKLEQLMKQNQGKTMSSSLQPMISMAVNNPGYKYNIEETYNLKINQFFDCCSRLQIEEQSRALLHGAYGGFVDTSHIDKDQFNFSRPINNTK